MSIARRLFVSSRDVAAQGFLTLSWCLRAARPAETGYLAVRRTAVGAQLKFWVGVGPGMWKTRQRMLMSSGRTLLQLGAAAVLAMALVRHSVADPVPVANSKPATPVPGPQANPNLVAAPDAPPPPSETPPPETPSEGTVGSSNPYRQIAVRNAFGLLPPPPPVDPDAAAQAPPPPPPPITVKLTGITDIFGKKRAMFVFTEQGNAKAQPKPVSLYEGDRESGVEVIAIDLARNVVRVNNNNLVTNITFAKMESSGVSQVPGSGGPGGAPRIPGGGAPGQYNAPPGGAGAVNAAANAGGTPDVIVGGADTPSRFGSRGGVLASGPGNGATSATPSPTASTGTPGYSGSTPTGSAPGTSTGTPSRPARVVPPGRYPVPPPLPNVPGVPPSQGQ
jgi:hypothetical protein